MFEFINASIDVKMLRTVQLLLVERNVSRVAILLGQSQPAVSQTLKRARAIFGDALLVRSGPSFVVTERGEAVKLSIESMLAHLSEALAPVESFDPATASTRIRIAAVNCFGSFLIPAIGAQIRREAPGIAVDFLAPADEAGLTEALGSGYIDIVIGNWPAPTPSLRHSALLECGIACVVRADHAVGETASLSEYLRLGHVSPTSGSSAAFSPIDGRLTQLGAKRHIAMSVPEYALIPALLEETDLVFTTARPYAEHIVSQARGHLRLVEAPAEFELMSLYLLWHERAQTSARNRWIRQVVKGIAKRFDLALHGSGNRGEIPHVIDFARL